MSASKYYGTTQQCAPMIPHVGLEPRIFDLSRESLSSRPLSPYPAVLMSNFNQSIIPLSSEGNCLNENVIFHEVIWCLGVTKLRNINNAHNISQAGGSTH